MVTVVPTLNRGASIAQALGGGIQSAANNPIVQQKYQRSQLQNALTEAQQIFNDPNASQTDKLFAYKKAYAGLDAGGDRAEASLIPHLLAASGGSQAVKNAPNLSGNLPQQQSERPQFQRQALPNFGESPGANRRQMQPEMQQASSHETGINVPTQPGIGLPKLHSAEEINQAARNDLITGRPDTPTAQLMLNENKVIEQEKNRADKSALAHAEISKANLERQKEFSNFARARNQKLNDPNKESVFNEIASQPTIANIDNEVKRFNAANEIFNQYEVASKNILDTGKRSNFNPEKYSKTIESLKTTMKPMLEAGQRGLSERLLAENGYGKVEIAKILNDFSPDQKAYVSKAASNEKYRNDRAAFDQVEQYYSPSKRNEEQAKLDSEKNTFLNDWKKTLEKTVKPGGQSNKNPLIFKPGTDLLLLRDEFLKKGGEYPDFNDLVLDMVNKGKVELDTYQNGQLPLLNENPRTSLGLWQVFLNSVPGYIERK